MDTCDTTPDAETADLRAVLAVIDAAAALVDWLYDDNQSVDGTRVVSRASDVAVRLRDALAATPETEATR